MSCYRFLRDLLITIQYHPYKGNLISKLVPSHWHQQSDEAFKEAEEVLETVKKKEVPTGNDEQVLSILENMIIDKSIE